MSVRNPFPSPAFTGAMSFVSFRWPQNAGQEMVFFLLPDPVQRLRRTRLRVDSDLGVRKKKQWIQDKYWPICLYLCMSWPVLIL